MGKITGDPLLVLASGEPTLLGKAIKRIKQLETENQQLQNGIKTIQNKYVYMGMTHKHLAGWLYDLDKVLSGTEIEEG